jgi:type I restriction enzyme S subunit
MSALVNNLKRLQHLKTSKKDTLSVFRFTDESGNEYPEWTQGVVSDYFTIGRGVVIPKTKVSTVSSEFYPYPVYSSQTSNQGIMGWMDKHLMEGKKITWTTDGAHAGTVFTRSGKYSCTNVCGTLTAKTEYPGYANNCVATALSLISKKYVSYVGNPKLMGNTMKEIPLNLPSLPEQQKIANFLSTFDSKIKAEEKKLELLKEQKQGYMQRIFA